MQSTFTDTTLRIIFDGDLLSTNVDALRQEIVALLAATPTAGALIADLKNSQVVDSKGVNLLIAIYREAQNRKFIFTVENPSSDIRRLLTMLNLVERFGLKQTS